MIPKQCLVCGAVAPLHAVHITPRTRGQRQHDFVYMCANCHAQLDRGTLRELEFEIVLADLMQASGRYTSVSVEPSLINARGERRRPDIVAQTGAKTLLIECKSAQTIGGGRLREAVAQLKEYGDESGARQLVLALPARLTQMEKASVEADGIQVWDLDSIASQFHDQLNGVTHPVLRPLLLAAAALGAPDAPISPEARLLGELRATKPGRESWGEFQKLVARVLERLFCPPLSAPIIETSDASRTNRRDIILPNYAETGFWRFVRERYDADYVAVDAKNYSDAVGKMEALQLLNYLKRHGAGLLGLIVTRQGPDEGCIVTMKEHWAQHQKLLVVLADEHIERMLRAREAGSPPEDVIRQAIEEFRLSI